MSTIFRGRVNLNLPLSVQQRAYLTAFARTRRVKRNAAAAAELPDLRRAAVGLPIGVEGEFYVGSADDGDFGQAGDASVKTMSRPPSTQPGLWCSWIPSKDGRSIRWNGDEKFYEFTPWLRYVIRSFLNPWGYGVNGRIAWRGSHISDRGVISVQSNLVFTEASPAP